RVVRAGCRRAPRTAARLVERGAGLGSDRGRPGLRRGFEVLDGLRRLAEVEEGEAAAVEALGIDLRHLVDEQELREAAHRLLQQILPARRVTRELRALITNPGKLIGRHQRHDLRLPPPTGPVELLELAVAIHDLLPPLTEP